MSCDQSEELLNRVRARQEDSEQIYKTRRRLSRRTHNTSSSLELNRKMQLISARATLLSVDVDDKRDDTTKLLLQRDQQLPESPLLAYSFNQNHQTPPRSSPFPSHKCIDQPPQERDKGDCCLMARQSSSRLVFIKSTTIKKQASSNLMNVLILLPIIFLINDKKQQQQQQQVCDMSPIQREEHNRGTIFGFARAAELPTPRQRFRAKQGEFAVANEGETLLLQCEVDHQEGAVEWLKDDASLFFNNTRQASTPIRFKLEGDPTRGSHNLRISPVFLNDSGQYRCEVYPRIDDGHHLESTTNLNVLPQARPSTVVISTPSASTSTRQQQQLDNAYANLDSLAAPIITVQYGNSNSNSKGSQLQARDAPNGYTKLISTSSSNSNSYSSSLNSAASNSNSIKPFNPSNSYNSNSASYLRHSSQLQNGNSSSAQLMLIWPYALMFFAAILFLANVYLIYSLFKKIRANNKEVSSSGSSRGSGCSTVEESY